MWRETPFATRHSLFAETALLSLKVCDMACGSGHFLVGAGHRLARHLARVRALAAGESEPSPLLYQTALRDVIGHCLYGMDINPMAVELCKVTLWLEALEPGKPLSFLDHHIRCGNSLLGATPELIAAGLPDAAFNPIEGDDKAACSSLKKLNRAQREGLRHLFIAEDNAIRDRLRQTAAAIDEMGDSRPEDIQGKEAAFRAEQSNYDFQKAWELANLWCAAFVIPKRFPAAASEISNLKPEVVAPLDAQPLATQGGLFGGTEELPKAKGMKTKAPRRADSENAIGITTQHLRDFVENSALPEGMLPEARRLAEQYQFFHWHLAFPEVFAQGGFDVSLGNPPWERVKLQEKEWFAAHGQESIANAPNAAARQRLIEQLRASDPALQRAFLDDVRKAEGESHLLRNAGLYPLCARGDINLYAVFAEGMRNLVAPAGRSGAVLPSGIATDDTTKFFFQDLVEKDSLRSLFDFENRNAIFPGVHRSYKFSLFTSGSSQAVKAGCALAPAEFAFFCLGVEDLRDPDKRFALSPEDISLLNPNTRTCPIFRSRRDAELTLAIYCRVPVLWREAGAPAETNPWGIRMRQGLFHLTNDSANGFVSDAAQSRLSTANLVGIYEAKQIGQFLHRYSSYPSNLNASSDTAPEEFTDSQLADPEQLLVFRYFSTAETLRGRIDGGYHHNWWLVYRDIARSTDERTTIAAIIPRVGVAYTLRVFASFPRTAQEAGVVAACLNSFAFDYCARQLLAGTHLSDYIFRQLPVLAPSTYSQPCPWSGPAATCHLPFTIRDFLLPRVLELTYTAWDLEPFAQDCGWSGPPFRWDEQRRFLFRCELDAAFFHLYLGTEDEWRQQPAALTQSFPTPRDAVPYIMDTFPIVKRKDEARTEHKNAEGEVVKPGCYITKDTILEIYDALAESMKTGTPYQTRLNPAPADMSCRHPKKKIGILAFGSLITDPGKELLPKITMRIKTPTPFGVEYGRISQTRGGAPTLVPHEAGAPVDGEILVLDDAVSLDEARNILWRRERRKEGTGETYVAGTSPNSVLVREWTDSPCVECVLYTDFNPTGKVATPQAAELAKQAIQSVKAAKPDMDGITYLMNNLASGIKTKLTPDYEAEILKQTKANSLQDALGKAKTI